MSADPAKSWAGEFLRSLASDAARWSLTALAAAIVPPAAILVAARDFATGSHAVPGWAILVAASLFGLLCLSVAANVLEYRRTRRRTISVVPLGYPHSLRWTLGSRHAPAGEIPVMGVSGEFQMTNLTAGDLAVPQTLLVAWCRVWRVFPYRLRVVGPGLYDALPAGSTGDDQLHWMIEPPIRANGKPLRAKVGLVDNFGRVNWSPWVRWPFMGGGA